MARRDDMLNEEPVLISTPSMQNSVNRMFKAMGEADRVNTMLINNFFDSIGDYTLPELLNNSLDMCAEGQGVVIQNNYGDRFTVETNQHCEVVKSLSEFIGECEEVGATPKVQLLPTGMLRLQCVQQR